MQTVFTDVEKVYNNGAEHRFHTNVPYITVDNFPKLGKLAAMRFLEWVSENPDGVISLPTGKTPEYFIARVKLKEMSVDEFLDSALALQKSMGEA